ncbi:MAG: hypothetical protein PHI27_06400 [Eubacteriales bacterium]|nr:hypothetical protein [Eubacteriales bacterium]MDD4512890.1 hypothetical protein [Eubacteriales bacterium]
MNTQLRRYHDVINAGDTHKTYTCDSWAIPDAGTEIWCTGWKRGQTIKPYGDGCHVIVGCSVYHCDQLLEILERLERDGYTWGIEGVKIEREQQLSGRWVRIELDK